MNIALRVFPHVQTPRNYTVECWWYIPLHPHFGRYIGIIYPLCTHILSINAISPITLLVFMVNPSYLYTFDHIHQHISTNDILYSWFETYMCIYIYKYISMDISLYYSYTQWIYPMDIWSMYPWYSQWMYRQSPGSPSLQLPRVSHRRCRSPRVSRCPNSSVPQGNSWRFTKFLILLYIYIYYLCWCVFSWGTNLQLK